MAITPANLMRDNLFIVAILAGSVLTISVQKRWPVCEYLMTMSFFLMFFVQAVFFPDKAYPGSRAISILVSFCMGTNHTLRYFWKFNRPLLIEVALSLCFLITCYCTGVGVKWFMHTPQQKAMSSMDDYLWEVTKFVLDSSIFYIVTLGQVAITLIVTKRGMVQSAAQLKQLRITNFRVYRKELAKTGLLIVGVIGAQVIALYNAGLGLTELVCSHTVVIFAMWKIVNPLNP